MKYFSPHLARRVFAFIIIGAFLAVLYISNPSFLKAPKVESATTDNVSGWAWSDTIGWISFNNTTDGSIKDYGVRVNATTGNFSGFAWSDNIGWISFNRARTNNPPSAPFNGGSGPIAKVDLSTGKVTGWARALSGCEITPGVPVGSCAGTDAGLASLGWDGWIKLSDDGNTNWGVLVDVHTGAFSGFAWGSEVVGWVDFALTGGGVLVAPPFKCTPTLDPYGVCGGTQVCSSLNGGTCIEPDGSCITNTDCGGGQVCNNGTCRPSDYCTIPADCASDICDLTTNTCALSSGTGCGDAVCGTGETLLTCPQDCKGKVKQF